MQHLHTPRTESRFTQLVLSQSLVGLPAKSAKNLRRLVLPAMLIVAGNMARPALASVATPSVPYLTTASDSGISHGDDITNVTKPTFSGTGIPLATLTLYAGKNPVGYAIVPPSGNWAIASNSKLTDGLWAMTVRQTVGGVQSGSSYPLSVLIDTVAPTTSTPDLTAESDMGFSNTDNLTNSRLPTFQGTTSPGAIVSLYNMSVAGGAFLGQTTAPALGNWKVTVESLLPSGTHFYQIAAKASDVAGNTSAASSVLVVGIDTDKPATPSTPDLVSSSDSGASNSDNITNVTLPTFTVKTEPYAQVKLRDFGTKNLIGIANADSNGNATIKATSPLSGSYVVYAECFDRSGNQAPINDAVLQLVVDTTAPAPLSKPPLDSGSDSGFLGDDITSDKTPTFSGFSLAVGPVMLTYTDGVFTHQVAAQPDGTHFWTCTLPALADGDYDVTARQSNIAGNSTTSSVCHLTIDTTPPAAPGQPQMYQGDYGVSDSDHITNNDYSDFYGMAEPQAQVELYNGFPFNSTTLVGKDDADYKGEWEIKKKFYHGAPLSVAAVAVDAAGNRSSASPQLLGLIDLTNPVATLAAPVGPFVQNFAGLSGAVSDPTTNGDASGVDKVMYRLTKMGVGSWSGTTWNADGNVQLPTKLVGGTWSVPSGLPSTGPNVSTQLQDGDYEVALYSYDKAGNQGFSFTNFTVDTIAPTSYMQTPSANAIVSAFPVVTGVADDYHKIAQVKVKLQRTRNGVTSYWNGNAFVTTNATVNATLTLGSALWNWDKQLPKASDLDAGVYTLTAYSYDLAGNVGTSASRSFTLSGSNVRADSPFAPSGGAS